MASNARVDPPTWVDRHGDVLYRYAYARVGDATVAEDLVQETLLAAIQGLDTFKQSSTERTWLVGILRHKVLDHFRRDARERRMWEADGEVGAEDDAFAADGHWAAPFAEWHSPEIALEQEEFWEAFERCVSALPDNLKTTFALRELDGVDSDDLAAILGTTKNNLWVMLSRARRRLRDCLQRHWFARN